jgi:hypothetical protein
VGGGGGGGVGRRRRGGRLLVVFLSFHRFGIKVKRRIQKTCKN